MFGANVSKTAILVDGGFYRKRARKIWGDADASARADELYDYCIKHITEPRDLKIEPGRRSLYRIFYYDCPPVKSATVWHPLLKRSIHFNTHDESYKWSTSFFENLASKRKVALRMGEQVTENAHYTLSPEKTKALFLGKIGLDDIERKDFSISFKQSGVDMRIGLDIASLAYNGIVDQVILISGDCDFVPVAKVARRHGIDFIVDPMGAKIRPEVKVHVDGIETFV